MRGRKECGEKSHPGEQFIKTVACQSLIRNTLLSDSTWSGTESNWIIFHHHSPKGQYPKEQKERLTIIDSLSHL